MHAETVHMNIHICILVRKRAQTHADHAHRINEQSSVFRASCDHSTALSISFFSRLFNRVSLGSGVERHSNVERARAPGLPEPLQTV